MATNNVRWIRNTDGATEPLMMLAKFQAGATQAIKQGELLEFTGDTNSAFVPLDSDFAMSGDIAIAAEEIKSGDLAGYYWVAVPRPGDWFEFALDSASAVEQGDALYYSSSEAVTTSGTYIIGKVAGQGNYPQPQTHMASGGIIDNGTTIASTSYVEMAITPQASYLHALLGEPNVLDIGVGKNFSATRGGVPHLFQVTCTAAGAEDETVLASAPFKFRIVDAWMISRDTNNVNVTLKNATNAVTGAVAKGGTDDAIVSLGSLIAEYDEVAAGAAVITSFSGAGSVDVCLLVVPIA